MYIGNRCGAENIFASDLKKPEKKLAGKFYLLDVCKEGKYEKIIKDHSVNYIIHLAAILSGIF
jgi:FlaA1/EpsC-like NDP-sugar epimerase